MSLRIGRTLPPAVASIGFKNIVNGILAMFQGDCSIKVFSEQLKDYFNVKHCFLLSSGKAALTVSLMALRKISPEHDEVLIPAYTCYSVPASIIRAGLKIRICDIDPETLDFDYEELQAHLTDSKRILCVIPTHLFGILADVKRVQSLIGGNMPYVLEDATQAMGEAIGSDKAGNLGDVGIISLGRGKAFSTVEGGILLTNNENIAAVIQKIYEPIPAYGVFDRLKLVSYAAAITVLIKPWLFWIPKSLPFLGLGETIYSLSYPILKLTPFQAGLADGWQTRLSEVQAVRKKNVALYLAAGVDGPSILKGKDSGYIRFPAYVGINERATILDKSLQSGLGLAVIYPATVATIPELIGHIVGGNSAKAALISQKLVSLPVHLFVRDRDRLKIISLLHSVTGTSL